MHQIKNSYNYNTGSRNELKNYNFKKANFDDLIADLITTDWSSIFTINDPDYAMSEFYSIFYKIIDNNVPIAGVKHNNRFPTWMSKETKNLIKEKNKLAKNRAFNATTTSINAYNALREQAKSAVESDRRKYFENIEYGLKTNPRTFFKNYAMLSGNKSSNSDLRLNTNSFTFNNNILDDHQAVANAFATSFASNFYDNQENEYTDLDDLEFGSYQFTLITGDQIAEKISSLKPNFNSLPGFLPTTLIKGCMHWIIPPLEYIFNLSISYGKYPDCLKRSIIIPRKKAGDPSKIENYRPIGNSDTIAKIFESLIASQINAFIQDKIIFNQHGFIPNRSTVTNLTTFTSDIADNIGRGLQTDAIYFDFSKAFDNVNYNKLKWDLARMGFSRNAGNWIISVLDRRLLYVLFNNTFSNSFTNNKGTSQGSPLSTTIFNIKINSITDVLNHSSSLLFADDIKIYRAISSLHDCKLLQKDIFNLIEWSIANKLTFNINKCYTMSFHRGDFITYEYHMNNVYLNRCSTIKDLGVVFNDDLSFSAHIDSIVKRASRNLGLLKRSTRYITNFDSLELLFNTFIRSILEFSSVIWSPYIHSEIHSIELILNNFLRFSYYKLYSNSDMYNSSTYNSVTRLRQLFRINTLENRREFTTLCFFKKLIDDTHLREMLFRDIISTDLDMDLRNRRIFLIPQHIKTNLLRNYAIYRFCSLYQKFFVHDEILTSDYSVFRKNCAAAILHY